jgi:capsular polysaccharide biosynthesis protein
MTADEETKVLRNLSTQTRDATEAMRIALERAKTLEEQSREQMSPDAVAAFQQAADEWEAAQRSYQEAQAEFSRIRKMRTS